VMEVCMLGNYILEKASLMCQRVEDRPVLEEAEELIAKWDQDSGLTYRELALRLRGIFAREKRSEVEH
jgi:hypothetical protein